MLTIRPARPGDIPAIAAIYQEAVRTGTASWELEPPTEAEMLNTLAQEIKRFAKRQMTWFRRDPGILWLNMAGDPVTQACAAVEPFLAETHFEMEVQL